MDAHTGDEQLNDCKRALAEMSNRVGRVEQLLEASRHLGDGRRKYIAALEVQVKAGIAEAHECRREVAEARVHIASLDQKVEELTHQIHVAVIESDGR